eukprot:augustus_masked-scaffold_41-processed-gene-1.45-mRNA-1 protein AED:1.00 eAED:1.00 QI:0/0/0/0/1/1/3/0/622
MLEVVSRLASGRFKWKIRASHYFDEVISIAKWGWNCKRLKRCKIKCSSDKNCSFEVNIKLNLETSKYIFLTTEELKMIKHLGVTDSGIAAADVALHRNFPGTLFDKELVKRIMKKAKEGVDASEENNIKKLITCGKRCLERGGRFDLTWDYLKEGKAVLNGVSFQEDLQNKLKKIYGDSIQVDSTHGMSRYRLVAMFPCGIDYFRKTINFGHHDRWEQNSGSSCGGGRGISCSLQETLSCDLELSNIWPKRDEKNKIYKQLGRCSHWNLFRRKRLDQLIENILVVYPEEPQQVALKKLRKKNKVCWEMTRKLPTFSHSATQRVESFHSVIKGNGSLKITLKTWSLDEVVTYHENNVDKYMERTLKKIKDLIRKDKDFPKEADEMFTKELKLMGACWIVEELSSRKFIVSDSNMRIKMKHVMEVVEREGVKLQSCTCETWTNLRFPCRHYARYCDRKRIQYMDIDHLPARWRYQEHPLFKQALREMGREVDGPRGCIEFKVKVPPLNAAYIPRKPEAKYSKLLTACKALYEEAKSSNEGWKKSYAAVLQMTAALRENPDGDFGDLDEVSEESGIMFESPRKRIKRRKGNGETSLHLWISPKTPTSLICEVLIFEAFFFLNFSF